MALGGRPISARWLPATANDRTDLASFLGRAVRLAPDAVVRLQKHPKRSCVIVWVIIVGTLVRREFSGQLTDVEDITVSAAQLALLNNESVAISPEVQLPAGADDRWRSSMPPPDGWVAREEIPTAAVISAVDLAGVSLEDLSQSAATNAGEAMLNQIVITTDGSPAIEIPLRTLLALVRMGFAAQGADTVRIATAGPWTMLATGHGAVYKRSTALDVLSLLTR